MLETSYRHYLSSFGCILLVMSRALDSIWNGKSNQLKLSILACFVLYPFHCVSHISSYSLCQFWNWWLLKPREVTWQQKKNEKPETNCIVFLITLHCFLELFTEQSNSFHSQVLTQLSVFYARYNTGQNRYLAIKMKLFS